MCTLNVQVEHLNILIHRAGLVHWVSKCLTDYWVKETDPSPEQYPIQCFLFPGTCTFEEVNYYYISTSGSDSSTCGSLWKPCLTTNTLVSNIDSHTLGEFVKILMGDGTYSASNKTLTFTHDPNYDLTVWIIQGRLDCQLLNSTIRQTTSLSLGVLELCMQTIPSISYLGRTMPRSILGVYCDCTYIFSCDHYWMQVEWIYFESAHIMAELSSVQAKQSPSQILRICKRMWLNCIFHIPSTH